MIPKAETMISNALFIVVGLSSFRYNNTIDIQVLDLFKTASVEGQVSYHEQVNLENFNTKIDERSKYLYPGMKEWFCDWIL